MGLGPSFLSEFYAVVGDGLVDIAVFVAFRLAVLVYLLTSGSAEGRPKLLTRINTIILGFPILNASFVSSSLDPSIRVSVYVARSFYSNA